MLGHFKPTARASCAGSTVPPGAVCGRGRWGLCPRPPLAQQSGQTARPCESSLLSAAICTAASRAHRQGMFAPSLIKALIDSGCFTNQSP